jgi:hypothetical protein
MPGIQNLSDSLDLYAISGANDHYATKYSNNFFLAAIIRLKRGSVDQYLSHS